MSCYGLEQIEDGELIRAGGEGTIRVPDLKSVGTIGMDWRTEGGKDIYSGHGSLNFTLFDDPATGVTLSQAGLLQWHSH